MNSRRSAFTLIELLVVIAIIAILAAILFPVFAQAKQAAKKTSALASAKQLGTAMIIYSTDGDDNFPSAVPYYADGTPKLDFTHALPAGWDSATTESADAQAWGNSIQPYVKNYQMYAAPGMPKYRYVSDDFVVPFTPPYGSPRKNWYASSYTFNGLLSTWSATAVNQPSRLTLLWQGEGKVAGEGYANSSPILKCDAGTPTSCKFNPGGPPQPGAALNSNGSADFWWSGPSADNPVSFATYGAGMIYVATDTSAKFKRNGATGTDSTGKNFSYDDPFTGYNAQGQPQGMRICTTNGSTYYRAFFRPDTDFTYPLSTTGNCTP